MKTDEELEKMFEGNVESAYCSRHVIREKMVCGIKQRECSQDCPFLYVDESFGYHEYCLADQTLSIQSFIAGYRAAEMDLSCKQ